MAARGGAAVVDGEASVVAAGAGGGTITPPPAPPSPKILEGTSSFTALFEDKVRLKTNKPVDSAIRKRLTPAVSEDTPRYGVPSKLKKTMSVAL